MARTIAPSSAVQAHPMFRLLERLSVAYAVLLALALYCLRVWTAIEPADTP